MVPPAARPYRAPMSLTEAEQEPLPPPDPPAPAVAHRVYRSQHRVVAGVAGGLSNAVGVAPMWGRLAFVVLTLFGGLGIALYVAAWLLLPAGPSRADPRAAAAGGRSGARAAVVARDRQRRPPAPRPGAGRSGARADRGGRRAVDPAVGAGARRHRGRPPPGRGDGSPAPPRPIATRPHHARAGAAGRRGGHGRQRRLTDRGEGGVRSGGPAVRGGPGRRRLGRMGAMADRPCRHLRRGERGRRGHRGARRPPQRLPRDVVLGPARPEPTHAAHPPRSVRGRAPAAGGHPAPRERCDPGRGRHGPHRRGERRPPRDPRAGGTRSDRPSGQLGGRVPAGGLLPRWSGRCPARALRHRGGVRLRRGPPLRSRTGEGPHPDPAGAAAGRRGRGRCGRRALPQRHAPAGRRHDHPARRERDLPDRWACVPLGDAGAAVGGRAPR